MVTLIDRSDKPRPAIRFERNMKHIISVSRRTDIPAFYFDWFLNRCRAGFCDVANPFNPKQVRRVSLRAEDVNCVVFWTKDPRPLLARIDELDATVLPYGFLFTLNRYPVELEPRLPPYRDRLASFRALAEHVGRERMVWRYDPIIVSDRTPFDWHERNFQEMASDLEGATHRVITSFVDYYRKTERRLASLESEGWRFDRDVENAAGAHALMAGMAETCSHHGMSPQTCAETVDYTADGVPPGGCISEELVRACSGLGDERQKDPYQRDACLCLRSRDIGATDSCLHGCPYCYATRSHEAAQARHARHDPEEAMLYRPGGETYTLGRNGTDAGTWGRGDPPSLYELRRGERGNEGDKETGRY